MAGQEFQSSTRSRRFLLGCLLILSASQLFVINSARSAQVGELAQGGSSAQIADMDHHDHAEGTVDMMIPHQQHRGPHMKWTALRPANVADTQRAEQIVQVLRQALAMYKDYRVAMNDGFVPMHPERQPKHYHFANKERRFLAKIRFDPAEPTALLYKKTRDGYELEGAMYTVPRGMSEDQLNDRVPLSVAQWHAHVNLCVAPDGSGQRMNRKPFGFKGPIATESECQQVGGRFVSQLGGWMLHVYPFETTSAKIWTH
jgi:hypothetical protein